MRHDSIAFEIQKSTWIRQKQLDRNIKELRYDRNKEYLYGEFKHYLVVNEHYDTIVLLNGETRFFWMRQDIY